MQVGKLAHIKRAELDGLSIWEAMSQEKFHIYIGFTGLQTLEQEGSRYTTQRGTNAPADQADGRNRPILAFDLKDPTWITPKQCYQDLGGKTFAIFSHPLHNNVYQVEADMQTELQVFPAGIRGHRCVAKVTEPIPMHRMRCVRWMFARAVGLNDFHMAHVLTECLHIRQGQHGNIKTDLEMLADLEAALEVVKQQEQEVARDPSLTLLQRLLSLPKETFDPPFATCYVTAIPIEEGSVEVEPGRCFAEGPAANRRIKCFKSAKNGATLFVNH